jgi:transcriptional regulator with XRE-family HTH domain
LPEWQRSLGGASRIVYLAGMKLADFLFESGMSTTQLRRALGVRCRSTISRYLHGDRVPKPATLQRIIELTGGKVQLQDFLRGGNPNCATIITLPSGRKKLVFPWANRESDLEAAEAVEVRRVANDDDASPPLKAAVAVIADRVRRRGGRWFMDGRPVDPARLIREANRILEARREPLIFYPGVKG